ncbi:MAG: DMT family transporter [Rhodoferax sp.]|nr:DMT family transporter [Rhodoferax sp.]
MQHNAARGIAFLCLGVFVFSLQDAIVKQVSGAYPLTQVLVLRALVAGPILLVLVQMEVGWRAIFASGFWPLTVRAGLMFVAYMAYYLAFPALPLADAVALYFTVPLFVTVLAGPFLGERANWQVWAAVAVGFVGVMVMLQPGSGLFNPAALLSLLAAAMYAGSMLMARSLGAVQAASVMSFYQNAVFLVAAAVVAACLHALGIVHAEHPSLLFLVRPWVMPNWWDGMLIASCGVVAAAGIMLLTSAYKVAKANVVAPFEYSGVLWAPLWGLLFFAEVPRLTTVAGAALIVGAGLVALRVGRH